MIVVFLFVFKVLKGANLSAIDIYIKEYWVGIISFSFTAFIYLIYKTTFLEEDKKNVIKKFDGRSELYWTNVVAAIYFAIFASSLILGVANFSLKLFTTEINLITLGASGLLVLLISMGINLIMLNVTIRDYGPDE